MPICRQAVTSNDYKGFGLPYRGSEEYVAELLGADCVRRVSDNLAFAYFYYPEEAESGREYPFGIMQKCYGLLSEEELAASGVLQLREGPYTNLYGSGVLLGFVDTGISYGEKEFLREDGTTKLLGIWDQTEEAVAEETLSEEERAGEATGRGEAFYGRVYSETEINGALTTETPYLAVPVKDENGHGTELVRTALQVAPLAMAAVVKLKQAKPYLRDYYQIPETAFCVAEEDIIYGVDWLLSLAAKENKPLVLCMALGSNQGNHTGQTVLSRYLEDVAKIPGVCVCAAAGNEGGSGHHYSGQVRETYEEVSINIGEGTNGFSMELWAVDPDVFTVEIISPAGEVIPRIPGRATFNRQYRLYLEGGTVWIQSNLFDQSVGLQGIWIRFAGNAPGIWRIRVYGEGEFSKEFHMWLPIRPFLPEGTAFLRPDPYTQICDPGAAKALLTYTAYDVLTEALAVTASYGYTADKRIKPELAAPKGEVRYEGTGMATAFGAGCAALLFEAANRIASYQILDTAVIKRLLISTAERGGREYPNREWGYGILNVYEAFLRTPGRGF